MLPIFLQSTSGTETALALTRPLPQFERHASLASVNLVPDKDSVVRVAEASWDIEGARVPSVFNVLSGASLDTGPMPIDFSIAPGSFAYFPYSDILQGRVPLEELRGKIVLVGATALELGDMQPVPIHRTLPGVVIHALATQTAVIKPVRPVAQIPQVILLAAWTLLFAWLFPARLMDAQPRHHGRRTARHSGPWPARFRAATAPRHRRTGLRGGREFRIRNTDVTGCSGPEEPDPLPRRQQAARRARQRLRVIVRRHSVGR